MLTKLGISFWKWEGKIEKAASMETLTYGLNWIEVRRCNYV